VGTGFGVKDMSQNKDIKRVVCIRMSTTRFSAGRPGKPIAGELAGRRIGCGFRSPYHSPVPRPVVNLMGYGAASGMRIP